MIIGDGAERKTLTAAANNNITFLGRQSDETVCDYLSTCQALIFPGEEDFGIAPVEAQASGRPVIAYRGGGALETVSAQTGRFFYPKTADALIEAVKRFDAGQFDSEKIREHARQFDVAIFREKMREILREKLSDASEGV